MPEISMQSIPSMNIADNYNSTNSVINTSLHDSQLFLKMLSVSLSNQDPLNPTDSNEFMNQMTQYATIETLTSVKTLMSNLYSLQLSSNMYTVINNASALTGKNVEIFLPKGTNGSTEDKTVTGVVDKVELSEDGIFLVVNGEKYEYDNLKSIVKS